MTPPSSSTWSSSTSFGLLADIYVVQGVSKSTFCSSLNSVRRQVSSRKAVGQAGHPVFLACGVHEAAMSSLSVVGLCLGHFPLPSLFSRGPVSALAGGVCFALAISHRISFSFRCLSWLSWRRISSSGDSILPALFFLQSTHLFLLLMDSSCSVIRAPLVDASLSLVVDILPVLSVV